MNSSSSIYDNIPKLLITSHGRWNVPSNYKKKGPPTFKLPYNTRIMYATGLGVVNYLEQSVPNMINNEYNKKRQYGLKKIKEFKKDLRSYDLYGCCDYLACKDNRRLNAPIIREIEEQEQDSSNNTSDRAMATEFLDQSDKPYRITSKLKGDDMPVKTFVISRDEFGKYEDGTNVRDITRLNDNRMILYIPGRDPIDVLYHWNKLNENEPYITAKLRGDNIELTLKTVLERVKKICYDLGIELEELDIIDLSCNVTQDNNYETAPKDTNARAKYVDKLKDMVFGSDEVLSSSPTNDEVLSSSPTNDEEDFFSMIIMQSSKVNKNTKTRVNKKSQNTVKKTRRSYIRK